MSDKPGDLAFLDADNRGRDPETRHSVVAGRCCHNLGTRGLS